MARRGTPIPPALIPAIVKMVPEMGIRATGRLLGLDTKTVRKYSKTAAYVEQPVGQPVGVVDVASPGWQGQADQGQKGGTSS
jgi:hypothetical protein